MISDFESNSYKQRLRQLGIFFVKRRFRRGDMTKIYKIFASLDHTKINKFFILNSGSYTREHDHKLTKKLIPF